MWPNDLSTATKNKVVAEVIKKNLSLKYCVSTDDRQAKRSIITDGVMRIYLLSFLPQEKYSREIAELNASEEKKNEESKTREGEREIVCCVRLKKDTISFSFCLCFSTRILSLLTFPMWCYATPLPITNTVRSVRMLCMNARDMLFMLVILIFLRRYIKHTRAKCILLLIDFFLLCFLLRFFFLTCSRPASSCCYLSRCLPFSLSICDESHRDWPLQWNIVYIYHEKQTKWKTKETCTNKLTKCHGTKNTEMKIFHSIFLCFSRTCVPLYHIFVQS